MGKCTSKGAEHGTVKRSAFYKIKGRKGEFYYEVYN